MKTLLTCILKFNLGISSNKSRKLEKLPGQRIQRKETEESYGIQTT